MRALILLLLSLGLASAAMADCPQGNNTPLTADTRATGSNDTGYGTHSSYGTHQAPRTAYPH